MKLTQYLNAFLFAFLLTGCVNGQNSKDVLSPTEFSKTMEQKSNKLLLDVRTPEEFKSGHLYDAVNVDWNSDQFKSTVAGYDKKQPVFVYCLSGGRSKAAATYLKDQGFKEVYELSGGIVKWRLQDLPETKSETARKEMSLKEYEKLVQSDKTILVDFYAEWCAPCKKMKPYLEEIQQEEADKVTVIRIDADQHPELCKQLKVAGLPVLKIYKNGELKWDQLGYVDKSTVVKELKKHE